MTRQSEILVQMRRLAEEYARLEGDTVAPTQGNFVPLQILAVTVNEEMTYLFGAEEQEGEFLELMAEEEESRYNYCYAWVLEVKDTEPAKQTRLIYDNEIAARRETKDI